MNNDCTPEESGRMLKLQLKTPVESKQTCHVNLCMVTHANNSHQLIPYRTTTIKYEADPLGIVGIWICNFHPLLIVHTWTAWILLREVVCRIVWMICSSQYTGQKEENDDLHILLICLRTYLLQTSKTSNSKNSKVADAHNSHVIMLQTQVSSWKNSHR